MSLSKTLVPSSGCLLGVYPGSSCDAAGSDLGRLRNHETKINRTVATNGPLAVVNAYHDWNDFTSSFAAPSGGEGTMAAEGRILLIHWTPRIFGTTTQFKWPDIAAGAYDAQYVIPTAQAMRDFGKPFLLAFHNEMNASSSADGGTYGTDAQYASAARHIHDVFAQQGASNVVWVFKPSGYQTTLSRMNALYPGDQFVDWIMWDPYAKNGEDLDYVMSTKYPMVGWATGTDPNFRKTSIPTGITVTPQGTPGATTYSYKLTSVNAAGETVGSAAVQTTTGNATLSGVNFNRIQWTVSSGATSTKVYGRTAGSWGLLATITAPTAQYDDTGAAVPGAAPPTTGAIGDLAKALGFAEWGVSEAAGPTTKPAFYDQVRTTLKTSWPQVKLAAYFNSTANNQCFDTSAAALDAYKRLAGDAYFRPDLSDTPPPVNQGRFRIAASKSYSNSKNQTLVVPDDVQAADSMVLLHHCTRFELRQAAEGTNAAAVSVGNSNTVGSNPWDAIAGTAPTYDTTSPLDGTSSMHAAVTAGTTSGGRWNTSFGWTSTYRGRLLYRYPSNPPAVCRIYQQAPASGNPQWGIGIETNGKISVRDLVAGVSRGTQVGTAPATGTKHRIEWIAAWDSVAGTTVVTLRLFLGANWNGSTPDEIIVSSAFAQAAAPGAGTFGVHFTASQTYDLHLDQMALDANQLPGLPGSSAVLTDPPGWSPFTPQILAAGAAELAGRAYRRVALAGDPGSTIALDTDVNAHGSIMLLVFSGTDPTTPVEVAASSTRSADGTTVVTPNVVTAGAADTICSVAAVRDNPGGHTTAWTAPLIGAGPDREAQRAATFPAGAADGRVAAVASDDGATHGAGTYGTKTFTSDRTGYLGIGWTFALSSPAAAGTGQGIEYLRTDN